MNNLEKGLDSSEAGVPRFETVKDFYNSLSSETLDYLDTYGFNNVGLQPQILLKIEGEENQKLVLEAVGNFLASVGEEKKRAAREIAEIADRVTS